MNRKKLIFAGLFGFVSVFTFLLLGGLASASDTVIIKSQNRNFDSDQSGAWRVTKKAEWIGKGKARLTLTAESKMIDAGGARDVVYIVDTSKSMEGTIDSLKDVLKYTATGVLSNSNNTMSLITFNTTAQIEQGMTNNLNTIKNAIDGMSVAGDTNYYDAIVKLEDLLTSYQEQPGRTLVVAFITDGRPGIQTPLEVSEYRVFKSRFPNSVVNGVQYNYQGVLEQLKTVSDYQIILKGINDEEYRAQFAEAVCTSYNFGRFDLQDIVDSNYFSVDSASATLGNVGVNGNTVSWDMSGKYRTGTTEELTIDITLDSSYLSSEKNEYLPNTKTIIKTEIEDTPSENIETTTSPTLTLRHNVQYNANAPSGCTVSGSLPTTTKQIVFDVVPISQNKLQCEGYTFKQFVIANDGVRRVNDDYLLMPNEPVVLKAMWEKIEIEKTTEGDIYGTYDAELDYGYNLNIKLKRLADTSSNIDTRTANSNVKAIKYADSLPADFTATSDNTISGSSSKMPIYAWYDSASETIYFHSNANKIKSAYSLKEFLFRFVELVDISGLSKIDTSSTRVMESAFQGCAKLSDLAPIGGWDVSHVNNFESMFSDYFMEKEGSITSLMALKDWDVSGATNMNSMFSGQKLTNLSGVEDWDIGETKMGSIFYGNQLIDISAISGWDMSRVWSIASMFNSNEDLTDISPLQGWNVENTTAFGGVFRNTNVSDLTPISGWDVSSGTNFYGMFAETPLSNLTPISGWNMENAEILSYMFESSNVNDLRQIAGWDVGKVKSLNGTFEETKITTLDGLERWTLDSIEDITAAFRYCYFLSDINGIKNWPITRLTSLSYLFVGTSLNGDSLAAIKDWDLSNITDLSCMFVMTPFIDRLDYLSGWNVSNVTDMSMMFFGSNGITSLEPLRRWDVSNVTDMASMFAGGFDRYTHSEKFREATNYTSSSAVLTSLSGLEGWNVKKVEKLSDFLSDRNALVDISALSGWQTESLTLLYSAFCRTKISSVAPLANWDVSKVDSFSNMFKYDYYITDLSPLNSWTVDSSASMSMTFDGVPTSVARPTWYHD